MWYFNKKLFLYFTLLFSISIIEIYSEEQIVEYKLKVTLSDSTSQDLVYIGSSWYLDSVQIGSSFNYINESENSIKFYKTIYSLDAQKPSLGWIPYAVLKDDEILISKEDIISAELLEYRRTFSYCNYLIENFDSTTLLKLKDKEPLNTYRFVDCFEADLKALYIISYNPKISKDEIFQVIEAECCQDFKLLENLNKLSKKWATEEIYLFTRCEFE